MRKAITVLLVGGPQGGKQVQLFPPSANTLDSMPPKVTVNQQHHQHEYTYSGRNQQRQHTYTYSHTK